jgi:hypothetical protein
MLRRHRGFDGSKGGSGLREAVENPSHSKGASQYFKHSFLINDADYRAGPECRASPGGKEHIAYEAPIDRVPAGE